MISYSVINSVIRYCPYYLQLPVMSTKNNWYYWTNGTRIIEPNESNTQGVNRYFPNLIPAKTL